MVMSGILIVLFFFLLKVLVNKHKEYLKNIGD